MKHVQQSGDDHHLDTKRGFSRIGRLFSILVRPFIRFDLPSTDDDEMNSPVIWAPNHRSMFDTVVGLVGLYRMGRTASFFVAAGYFDSKLIGRLLGAIGAIPVTADSSALKTLNTGVEHLRAGNDLVIMAEGRLVGERDRRNGIGELESGIIVLARRASVPIVPTALIGADEILPIGSRIPRIRFGRRRLVVVRFGSPLVIEGKTREAKADLTADLGNLVVATEAEHRERSR